MVRVLETSTVSRWAVYAAFVVLVCPALLWWGAVDLPDEFLEFNTANLAFHAREFAAGRIPQWNPYVLGGMPLAAAPSSIGPWYPAGLLLLVLPLDLFVLLAWILHLGLGGAGVHRLAEACGARSAGATGAAVVWLSGTTCVTALVDGQLDVVALLAWLPWALVALQRSFEAAAAGTFRSGLRDAAWAAAALGLVGLGTHARFAALGFAATGLFGAALWATDRARPPAVVWAALIGFALATGTLIAAPEVLPAVLEVQATRSGSPGGDLVGQALSWPGLTGLLYPRAFVIDQRWYHLGAAGLLLPLSLFGNRRAWAIVASGALLVAAGMGLQGPLGPLIRPVLWALYPVETGAAALGMLFLAVGVGLGLDRVLEFPVSRRAVGGLGVAAVAILITGWAGDSALYVDGLSVPAHHARLSALHGACAAVALLGAVALRGRLGAWAPALLVALLVLDGVAYAWRVEAAIHSPRIAPSEHAARPPALEGVEAAMPGGRVVQLPLRPVREFSGRALEDLWRHPGHGWGHDPTADPTQVIPREAAAVLGGRLQRNAGGGHGVAQAGGRAKVAPMPWSVLTHGLSADRGLVPELARSEEVLTRTLELLGARWVLSTSTDWPLPPVRDLGATPDAALRVELSDPRPSALLSPRIRVEKDSRAALESLLRGPRNLRDNVVLSTAVSGAPASSGPAVVGNVLEWAPGRWRVRLPEHRGGVMTVLERFHPGWGAMDGNGRALTVVRANLVHLGVVVPPDVRTIELSFRAPGTRRGTGAGLLGLALFALGLSRFGRPRRTP